MYPPVKLMIPTGKKCTKIDWYSRVWRVYKTIHALGILSKDANQVSSLQIMAVVFRMPS